MQERRAVEDALVDNLERREAARAQLDEARDELESLLVRGQDLALDVAAMARLAGISRDTAHRLLKRAGSIPLHRRRSDDD